MGESCRLAPPTLPPHFTPNTLLRYPLSLAYQKGRLSTISVTIARICYNSRSKDDIWQKNSKPTKGIIYFTQVYVVMELITKLRPCFKYIIPHRKQGSNQSGNTGRTREHMASRQE